MAGAPVSETAGSSRTRPGLDRRTGERRRRTVAGTMTAEKRIEEVRDPRSLSFRRPITGIKLDIHGNKEDGSRTGVDPEDPAMR